MLQRPSMFQPHTPYTLMLPQENMYPLHTVLLRHLHKKSRRDMTCSQIQNRLSMFFHMGQSIQQGNNIQKRMVNTG